MNRLASLSVDLDSLKHYCRIHGLDESVAADDPVYTTATQRFGELCDKLGLKGTAFCIGEDLEKPEAAASIRKLAAAGHEIANHSYRHDYALTRLDPGRMADEVRLGAEAIERACGKAPVGFRAPGYTMSGALLSVLVAHGYRYDSSIFPATPYWLAKAGLMAALTALGEPSRAILDSPRVLFAPREPYHPRHGAPHQRGDAPIWEIPMAIGLGGFPVIGTFVAALPGTYLRPLARGAMGRPLFNLELHGIDFLDRTEVPPALASRQRDLAIPAKLKIHRIKVLIRSLRDREWVTLAGATEQL